MKADILNTISLPSFKQKQKTNRMKGWLEAEKLNAKLISIEFKNKKDLELTHCDATVVRKYWWKGEVKRWKCPGRAERQKGALSLGFD